jgi:hypothetical protein
MDFKQLKQEATKLKNKATQAWKDAVEFGAWKLADSSLTLKTVEQLEKFIEKSLTTTGKDSATGKEKKFSHQVIVIFSDTKSDFFKDLLYELPVLSTKAFSQNIALRLADISMKDLDAKKYQVWREETLVVFENKEVIKVLGWEESIQKVVKSLSLYINKSIEEL